MQSSNNESDSDEKEPEDTAAPSSSGEKEPEKPSTKEPERPSVKKKLRTFSFGRPRKTLQKDGSKKRKGPWNLGFNCRGRRNSCDVPGPPIGCDTCICTGFRKTEDNTDPNAASCSNAVSSIPDSPENKESFHSATFDFSFFNAEDYPVDDWDERARQERAREIEEGVDPPPGFRPNDAPTASGGIQLASLTYALRHQLSLTVSTYPYLEKLQQCNYKDVISKICQIPEGMPQTVHTQIDYIHCLVPDLLEISKCSFYWGKMDRYEAEKLLENKAEGTFLLRDSAQEDYLFSVSFRRYGRSLHARIEQWNHRFSFDSHDPGVYASSTVCGLIEHYKDPSCCMFFEPMLTIPLHRTTAFSLQHLCRSVICSQITYDKIHKLILPKSLKLYLTEYHYKQRVRVRRLDLEL